MELQLFDNFKDPVCAFSGDNKIIFKNKQFLNAFPLFKSVEKFKKYFNFDLCFLSFENLKDKTPIDLLLQSNENFHTICTYNRENDEFIYYYIYTFVYEKLKIVVFNDITSSIRMESVEKRYKELEDFCNKIKQSNDKFEKLKEHALSQALKMGIINRISLVIRETNDVETVLSSTLSEIHSLLGSFKTYFSRKDKNYFKVRYSVLKNDIEINTITEYEQEIIKNIKNKSITVSTCLKEYINAPVVMKKGIKRIIIPVYDKNKLLGIIVTLTKQHFNEKENSEILQSISVQLASAIVQADLIYELDKKNKKLNKTLTELKDMQIHLINTEKMASIGQVAAGIAHEINTPLAAINSNSEIIRKILNKGELESRIEMLKELNSIDTEAVKRISDIVKSLKRFVRLDEAEYQEADINHELDLTLKLLGHEIKKNTVIIRNYGELPFVKCYVNMINQVFMNLIVNACHSIDENQKQGCIELTTIKSGNNVILKVKDNGSGISENNKSRIFEEGFTTKKAGIGMGLGLSISKKIIEMHKGHITFTTKEKEGSEFVVSLPIL